MRPCWLLVLLLATLLSVNGLLLTHRQQRQGQVEAEAGLRRLVVAGLGLTDLCLSTEARYTRHPAISDPLVPAMDHPAGLEHFPSGSFWTPPGRRP